MYQNNTFYVQQNINHFVFMKVLTITPQLNTAVAVFNFHREKNVLPRKLDKSRSDNFNIPLNKKRFHLLSFQARVSNHLFLAHLFFSC